MLKCDQMDLSKFLGPDEFTDEELEHIRSCPECSRELEEIKAVHEMFVSYFDLAEHACCPCEKKIPALVWPPDGQADKDLEAHMKKCPVCTRAYLELKNVDHAVEPPSGDIGVPEWLKQAVRDRRRRVSASRTRKVLENFADQTRKGRHWVEEVLNKAFSQQSVRPAPAARQDLTRVRKENKKQKPDKQDPDQGTDQDQDQEGRQDPGDESC